MTSDAVSRLERFKTAQNGPHAGFEAALHEVKSGRKRRHWIWYIFPQLSGLGRSRLSQIYAIDGEQEATAFLRDDELRERLLRIARAVAERLQARSPERLDELMGSDVDAAKVVSSLTLFGHVARKLTAVEADADYAAVADAADAILAFAAAEGRPRCALTLQRLRDPDRAASGA
jgi:uncharacterized protein (DUF1810 family)